MAKGLLASAVSAGALALILVAGPAWAQQSTDTQSDASTDSAAASDGQADAAAGEIVVTGFRGSLNKAVELKRESISFRDSIVAEDIGKFPEANVADSLQRIPGVILSRDGASNEGQRISIRGLGSEFTVTTINGAPVRTTSATNVGGSSRDFNYDVFPSELFGRVDVYKSPLANLEEGGIGGNVDLQTPRPFDSEGRVIRYTAQANYNTQSKAWRPRGSLLLSDTWGNFGALFGVAYAKNVNERSGFQSTGGGTSGYNSSALGRRPYYGTVPANTSGPFNFELNLDSPLANFSGLTRSQVENAYLPRFYRVFASNNERERLGFVGSLQYKSDRFEASVDGIYSDLTDQTDEFTFGVPVRNSRTVAGSTSIPGSGTNSGLIPLDVHLDEYNNLYGTFGNSSILTESFYRDSHTKFKYGIVRAAYDITDTMKLSAQANLSESKAVYSENRIVSNIYGITTTFDPSDNITYPTISSPVDFTNTALYRAPSLGFAINDELDKQKTARAVLDWKPVDTGDQMLALKLGGSYVSSTKRVQRQDGSSIATNTHTLPGGGTVASNPTGVFANMDPFVQFGALANGGNSGYPSQFATFSRDFVMNVLDANGANRAATPALNQAFTAEEIVKSAFFETSFKFPIAGHAFRGNFGIRFSDTKTRINNYQTAPGGGFTPAEREGGYTNLLPSASFTFDITPKLMLRGSAGQTITRGSLATIAAGTRVPNIFNPAVTVGNPDLRPQLATTFDAALEWYFAPGGLISGGVFQKNIVDRPFSITERVPFGTLGLPSNLFNCASLGAGACPPALGGGTIDPNFLFDRTITVNQNELKLKGLELAYQQNFTFLPKPFDGLGITSSFTLIDQEGDDFVLRNGDRIAMQGVPDYTYSVTAFYEKGPFSIRGSYNYRAKTGQNSTNTGNDQVPYLAPQGFLDGTISYKLNDLFELRIDALNITNENVFFYYEDPTQPDGNGLSRRDNSFFNGTTISFGIRGRF
ncbi:TonB-dependent receptor [Sphingomonas naasensis]|uniref:TonB-dependent receptor n=1 Tax=Sphingomonas naasensis TaxID=1344951 RepID=A0A4S1WPI0_9SPHN|nr:TonB-dependent receptor [Sphingomonas naasensis]NIJ20323.1 TonB-dependent receptor [Sphingomonas naasensis]TGX44445.1 TonB-dependent receptor [Sphingomonas naasensis]